MNEEIPNLSTGNIPPKPPKAALPTGSPDFVAGYSFINSPLGVQNFNLNLRN